MSAHNSTKDLYKEIASGRNNLPTVTASTTLNLQGRDRAHVNVTATCTVTLPSVPNAGVIVTIGSSNTSVVTINDATGGLRSFTGTSGTTMARCTSLDPNSWGVEIITVAGEEAAAIAIADAGGYTTTTNVETALQEVMKNSLTVHVPFGNLFDPDGDPIVKHSAAPTPGYTVLNSEALGLQWAAHGTPTAVVGTILLPPGLDETNSVVTLNVIASKTGATLGDAVTFTVTAFPQVIGALHDAHADIGGVTTAMTGNATAKTVQRVTLSLSPIVASTTANSTPLTFTIKPTNGTLGTDNVLVESIYFTIRNSA
jgi:hypothetical protein